eukprot:scaffold33805_cov63-Phaeocystis_antarctica.AAC.2
MCAAGRGRDLSEEQEQGRHVAGALIGPLGSTHARGEVGVHLEPRLGRRQLHGVLGERRLGQPVSLPLIVRGRGVTLQRLVQLRPARLRRREDLLLRGIEPRHKVGRGGRRDRDDPTAIGCEQRHKGLAAAPRAVEVDRERVGDRLAEADASVAHEAVQRRLLGGVLLSDRRRRRRDRGGVSHL